MVKRTHADSRPTLGRFLGLPGGIGQSEALERAHENLQTVRPRAVAAIDESLARIGGYLSIPCDPPPEAVRTELYRLSNEIVCLAGTFQLGELGRTAYQLCELLDRLDGADAWSREAVQLHYEAMMVLRRQPEGAGGPLVWGLQRLAERVLSGRGPDQ